MIGATFIKFGRAPTTSRTFTWSPHLPSWQLVGRSSQSARLAPSQTVQSPSELIRPALIRDIEIQVAVGSDGLTRHQRYDRFRVFLETAGTDVAPDHASCFISH